MIGARGNPGPIKSELDAAFAYIQTVKAKRDLGHDDARTLARKFVANTTKSVRKALSAARLSESETRLVEAKLAALAEAAGRIPE